MIEEVIAVFRGCASFEFTPLHCHLSSIYKVSSWRPVALFRRPYFSDMVYFPRSLNARTVTSRTEFLSLYLLSFSAPLRIVML